MATIGDADYRELKKELKEARKYLGELTAGVAAYLEIMDKVMWQPAGFDRGRRIASLHNSLAYMNDAAWHFGLGRDLPVKIKRKKKT